jgi:hypothetical protein
MTKERWLQDRKDELLPVKYFHNVFTLPHELNVLVLVNKTVMLKMLFLSAAEALQAFAKDPKWKLEGRLGFIAALHTWSQTLLDHFHLHCLIPAGALSFDRRRWIPARDDYLFCVQALSRIFRGKFLFYLKQAYRNKELAFHGRAAPLESPRVFYRLLDRLYHKDWVVYSKRPFAGPAQVLEYLGRYTHRIAISNNRIKAVQDGKVTFTYKDRSDGSLTREMTLSPDEFIRRFLLHVVPNGFMRIRHFGFLANVCKKKSLRIIRDLLGDSSPHGPKAALSIREMMLRLTGIDIALCPRCKTGTMVIAQRLPGSNAGHDPPSYGRAA